MKKLTRSNTDKKLLGVCGGIAEYFDIDSTIVRILFLLLLGFNIIIYLIMGLILPVSNDYKEHIVVNSQNKRLHRSRTDRKLLGVCGGIAEYFDIDSTIVRLGYVLGMLFLGIGILFYIVCAFVMPDN